MPTDPTALVHNDRLHPTAIETYAANSDAIDPCSTDEPSQRAALAIACALRGDGSTIPALISCLDDDELGAQAAAWALGHLDAEGQLLELLDGGSLDEREHAYRALAAIAARGSASDAVAGAMQQRIDAELARAEKGLTSLAEHATRVLAVLGDSTAITQIQRVIECDQLADRFELQRQRKQVENEGFDRETIQEYSTPWTEFFSDYIVLDDLDPETEAHSENIGTEAIASPAAVDSAPLPPSDQLESDSSSPDNEGQSTDEPDLEGLNAETGDDQEALPDAPPVDWDGFFASPEFIALDEATQQLAQQLAPMIEQLTMQVARLPLTAISGQELAGLLLQVLPQAAPPQVVQAALSPHALNGFQALATFLTRTEVALHDDLGAGVKMVRETIREQVRQSGMLGGPDYSDPDESTPADPVSPS